MGAYVEFATANKEQVLAQISTSFISLEQARINMEKELPDWVSTALPNDKTGLER